MLRTSSSRILVIASILIIIAAIAVNANWDSGFGFSLFTDGVLVNLRFAAVGGAVSALMIERMMFNEGETQVVLTEGRVELAESGKNF